jgi:sugar/nucleoside kinase (ribokinase family)
MIANMNDVFALGDIIIDFTPFPPSANGNPVYECNPGGTVANLAASAAMLGLKTVFAGKVGDDELGRHIVNVIASKGVDVSGVVFDKERFSTQTFVMLKDGERSFFFSRRYNADIFFTKEELNMEQLESSKILHVSGMNFSDDPIKTTSMYALEKAREKGIITALDLNYRPALWHSEADFCATMPLVIRQINVFKGSDEETLLLTGEKNLDNAAEKIHSWGPEIVFITGGPKGAYYYYRGESGSLNTYDTERVDTTGAGDSFMGALLYRIIQRNGIADFTHAELADIVDFANAAGAASITGRGAASSMPTLAEVESCRANTKRLIMQW